MIAVIDRLLLNPVPITVNGEQTTVTALEAIVLQLLRKGMEGSARARRVMLKYLEFANQKCEEPARDHVCGQRLHPIPSQLDGGSGR